MNALNICGRTQKQQDKVEQQLLKEGSLWGRFDILHTYVFTKKEVNQVKKAQEIIFNYEKKRMNLVNV